MEETKKKSKLLLIIGIVVDIVAIVAVIVGIAVARGSKDIPAKLEEQAENAEVLDWKKIHNEYEENQARALDTYNKKVYKYTANVVNITSNYCEVGDSYFNRYDQASKQFYYYNTIKCYLPKSDLVKLNKDDKIEVIGTFILSSSPALKSAHLLNII